jgi:DNA-binding winged helix-turn-helix (wHTH) protein/Tol biopolymer transport system component
MASGQDHLLANGPLGSRRFRVGSWTADPQVNEISSGERSVKLEPKVMALLVYLAERPSQTVSRDELIEGLWGGVAVVEEALTRCVSQLRRSLADDAQDPRYIQTVSKRGYRLVAPVVLDESRRFETREAGLVAQEPKLALVARETSSPPRSDDLLAESSAPPGDPSRDLLTPTKEHVGPGRTRAVTMITGASSIAIVATLIGAVSYFRASTTPKPDVRFTIDVPEMPSPYDIALSPDGRHVAYVAAAGKGRTALWIRAVNSLDARALPQTEGATEPFWSPDSKYVAYGVNAVVDSYLKKIDVRGGAVQTIANLGSGNFCCGTWNRDGVIVFSHNTVLHRVSASGGEMTTISKLDPAREELFHARPQFLPDGRHFLYLAWSARPELRFVQIASLNSDNHVRLMKAQSNAVYAPPGFLLFLSERTLVARPFDAERMELTGEAVPLARNIVINSVGAVGAFAASNEGTIIYRSASPDADKRPFVWIDRDGRPVDRGGAPTDAKAPRLSPDQNQVAFAEGNAGAGGVWVHDLRRGLKTQVISQPASAPIWSPDGSRVLVGLGSVMSRALYEKPSNGAAPERLLFRPEPGSTATPVEWSAAGEVVVFTKNPPTSLRDLWVYSLSQGKAFPYLVTPYDEPYAALSPDGRWLAYESSESGTYEVVVQSFPDPSAGKWQITANGGVCPRWRRDGKELYHLDADGAMVATPVRLARTVEIGKPVTLFQTKTGFPSVSLYRSACPYDVTADGEQFVLFEPGKPVPISVILNWTSTLQH